MHKLTPIQSTNRVSSKDLWNLTPKHQGRGSEHSVAMGIGAFVGAIIFSFVVPIPILGAVFGAVIGATIGATFLSILAGFDVFWRLMARPLVQTKKLNQD